MGGSSPPESALFPRPAQTRCRFAAGLTARRFLAHLHNCINKQLIEVNHEQQAFADGALAGAAIPT
jgi:hypothetical protein